MSSGMYTLITGATGHLGKSFCHACARRGENLYLTGRSEEKLAALAAELQTTYGVAVEYGPCLLHEESSRSVFFQQAENRGVQFSKLLNVAGADVQKSFEKYTQEKLIFQVRANFEAAVDFTRFFLSHRTDEGAILTVASVNGLYSMPYFALYSATKGAEIQFFSALREELRDKNVKVTTVLPGAMPTREDVKEQIKGQGLWGKLAAKSTDFVAEKSLTALQKNKRIYIPGFWNRALQGAMKLVPVSLKIRLIAKRWKKIEKDAF